MGLWDNIKNIMTIPEDDEYDDENLEQPSGNDIYSKKEESENDFTKSKPDLTKPFRAKSNPQPASNAQVQVVLVKPDRFEDVTAIADHINTKKTVVLNLESANRDLSRRIMDFLGGVAYANNGTIRKVANSTYIIAARDVGLMGELMLDDYDDSKLYF